MPEKITLDDAWANLRDRTDKFKAGERRLLYEIADTTGEATAASGSLLLMRHVIAHILRDWSLDEQRPRVVWTDGRPTGYEHMETLDQLDVDFENELLIHARWWMDKITLNLNPSVDRASPTGVSAS